MHESSHTSSRFKGVEWIPLFPLATVLLPGSQLELRIFEPRYLAMIDECGASNSGFGVVRIEEGGEALSEPDARQPSISPVGCHVRILDRIPLPAGHSLIRVLADHRFEVLVTEAQPDRLLRGRVTWLEDEKVDAIPERFERLVRILSDAVHDYPRIEGEIDLRDANQVSWWLARLRVQDVAYRQQILTLNSPLERLRKIDEFIAVEGES